MHRTKDIITEDQVQTEHEYTEGEPYRKEKHDRYKTREDNCIKCNCVRTYVIGKKVGLILCYYERSGQLFLAEHEPLCFGNEKI